MPFQFNRSIAFTSSWVSTLMIGLIFSAVLVFILIFLQPFDSYGKEIPYKELKMAGYAICILFPILGLHPFELRIYRSRGQRWFVLDEVIFLLLGFFLMSFLSFIYNSRFVNDLTLDWGYVLQWTMEFSLPFVPVFIPLWAYLRFRFSKVDIPLPVKEKARTVTIAGSNSGEQITFKDTNFILARAQSNYVDIFLKDGEAGLQKHILRTTLSGLVEQIPVARQIHRSYLVNVDYIQSLQGNSRQGSAVVEHIEGTVPVSPKHFSGLKKYLQTRP